MSDTTADRRPWILLSPALAFIAALVVIPMAFILVYFAVFGMGTLYILRLMARRPENPEQIEEIGPARAARNSSAARHLQTER